ncbi:hypothetical protein I4F81_009098 [Pyropia yezoensis]|uniref:Uncharacterized protein n=1 Tax=Pyropia yezoensis TaxID=2788 RepID=A0ACC3C8S9_PYRYE|nr:hypothetical protein I4F81_009098 [Neopyropia yezoensis]
MEGDTLGRPADPDGAGASMAGDPDCAHAEVGLLDLPDDVLRLVVGCIFGCVGGPRRGDHIPLLLTCRRLAAIGYSSVQEVHISSGTLPFVETDGQGDPGVDGRVSAAALLASPAGERLLMRIFSIRGFLRHVPNAGRVVLSDDLADGAVTANGALALQIFWGLLRGALAPLPVSALGCDHSAVSALCNQQLSSVPLRCLHLGGLDARDEAQCDRDQYRGVRSVLGRHRRTLQELRVEASARGPVQPDGFAWSKGYLLSLASASPQGVSSSDSAVVGRRYVAALKSCAALPAALDLGGLGCWTQELLYRLCDDSNEVASLRELTISVAAAGAATLDPLARLPGLTHLTLGLEAPERSAEGEAPPDCGRPGQLPVRTVSGLGGALNYGSSMLRALLASGTRLSQQARSRSNVPSDAHTTEETAGRVATQLPALQHLTMGDESWSFAGGRVVGRST